MRQPRSMPRYFRTSGRIFLRDFEEQDRAEFLNYQTDPRYLDAYDFERDEKRPNDLFELFLKWQEEQPRTRWQFAICDRRTRSLIGCGGLRKVDDDIATAGIELAPSQWGRYRVALDASTAIIRFGFDVLRLKTILGHTTSGNRPIERLARLFGAEVKSRRSGQQWLTARGWQEVEWELTKEGWERALTRT